MLCNSFRLTNAREAGGPDGRGVPEDKAADAATAEILVSTESEPFAEAGRLYLAWADADYPKLPEPQAQRVYELLSEMAGYDCADTEGSESY